MRVDLVKLDGRAFYRSHLPEDDPLLEYVSVQMDRDRFNALDKPGYLDVEITPVSGNGKEEP